MKKLTLSALALVLAGCASQPPAAPAASPVADVAQFDNLRLCQASADMMPLMAVNPSSHPEYKKNWLKNQALDKEIARRKLNCSRVRAASVAHAAPVPLSPRQKQIRLSAVCNDTAARSQFANPAAIVEACQQAARHTPARCKQDLASFTRKSRTLTGIVRAEYIEIQNAVRTGCNLRVN